MNNGMKSLEAAPFCHAQSNCKNANCFPGDISWTFVLKATHNDWMKNKNSLRLSNFSAPVYFKTKQKKLCFETLVFSPLLATVKYTELTSPLWRAECQSCGTISIYKVWINFVGTPLEYFLPFLLETFPPGKRIVYIVSYREIYWC